MHNKEKKMVRRVVVAQRSSYNSSSTKEIPACARLFCFFVAIGLLLSIVVLLLLRSSPRSAIYMLVRGTQHHAIKVRRKRRLSLQPAPE
jgi:hypothetical protein